jgi:predicted RNase H-like HicB family nuclease
MRKRTYSVGDGSYGVYWPDLPGCTSFGKTLPLAQEMAMQALGLHISGMEHW